MNKLFLSFVLLVFLVPVALVSAQSMPANYIDVNFSPITNSTSYNYDWSAGTLTVGTATASLFSTQNVLENSVSDPTPPDPNGYGTFIGTARPVKSPTGGGAVLYEQSVCADGYPTCLSDGSLTYGDMVMYPLRGATLDQLTTLQTDYYVEHGCFGGGSPRFQNKCFEHRRNREYLCLPRNFPRVYGLPYPGYVVFHRKFRHGRGGTTMGYVSDLPRHLLQYLFRCCYLCQLSRLRDQCDLSDN